ncbi:MAG: hypothetical protein ABWX92_09915, partial [Mycetocola sp.]
MNTIQPLPTVTRVEVIDNGGRAFVIYGASKVQMHIQDEGRTLKVFLDSASRPRWLAASIDPNASA